VEDKKLSEEWNVVQAQLINTAKEAYNWAVKNGIAKEQARAVLPEGNTESIMIVTGTLRSWVHYCQLRMDKATQKEHRIVAEQCWDIIKQHFPNVAEACESLGEI
jgi:thymidylate synthase (FAD)